MELGCIYCGGKKLTDEHYLPEGLGRFLDFEVLSGRVCEVCQGKCSQLEEQFLRSSPEAFFRRLVARVGKKHHKKVEMFYRRHAGTDPIQIVGTYPGEKYPILWEPNEGQRTIREMRQIIVADDKGEYYPIPVSDTARTAADLKPVLQMFEGKKVKVVAVFADPPDFERMRTLVTAINPKGKVSWKERTDESARVNVVGTATLTDRYFRAIAKIGFHYFLKMSGRYTGHEDIFNPIKNFIIKGGDWRPHVQWHKGSLAANVDRQMRPNTYLHLLVGEKLYTVIRAKMQFFVGPDIQPFIYEVRLAANPERIIADEQWAHAYVYFDKKDPQGFDGIMEPMTTISKALIPYRVGRQVARRQLISLRRRLR